MNIDKIFLALSESYRKAIASIVLCSLMLYPILYFSINTFKTFDWFVQTLITIGVATTYIGTYTAWTIAIFKSSDVFFIPVGIVATCGFGEIINWVYRDTFSLQGFVCRLLIFTFITFALIYVFEYIHRKWGRKKMPE